MKKILYATDFSDGSSTAFEFALAMAKALNASLTIVHTYTAPYVEPTAPIPMVETMYKEIIEQYQSQLDTLKNTALALGIPTNSELLLSDVASGINDVVEQSGIDYLVIGKTSSTTFMDRLIGTNTSVILNDVKIPTVVVPYAEQLPEISRIMYATQLEYEEAPQLDMTFELAQMLDASLRLVYVKSPNEMDIENDVTFIHEIDERYQGRNYSFERIEADSVVQGIQTAINLYQINLLTVTTHSRSFFSQLLNPSKTQALAEVISIPMMVLHFADDGTDNN